MRELCVRFAAAARITQPATSREDVANMGQQTSRRQIYERSLTGMMMIAFITDLADTCNWFLSFCALTWASAVLLGAYVEQLGKWDFYNVSLLLFLEGLRIGVSALLRLLSYRLSTLHRWVLRYVAFFIALIMGGFALFSLLPGRAVYNFYLGSQPSLRQCPVPDTTRPLSNSSYLSLCPSIYGFYGLILANTLVFLLGSTITGLLRHRYVKPSVKSLSKYYDDMIYRTTSWLDPALDLHFAFKIQGSQYRRMQGSQYLNGKIAAQIVCELYADLIWYLYMHEKGVEAAESALAAEDGYVREAAAYIVGFWAVLDTLEEVKECRLPLCFERRMLSELAKIAAENYGSLGMAAARSFALLLESVELEIIGTVAHLQSGDGNKDLIDILIERAAELVISQCPQSSNLSHILQRYSHAHIYALRRYIQRLQDALHESGGEITAVSLDVEAQQAQLLEKMSAALPSTTLNGIGIVGHEALASMRSSEKGMMLSRWDEQLSGLVPSSMAACYNNYYEEIWGSLTKPPPKPRPWKALLFHMGSALVCLGVGALLCLGVGSFLH